eukprot:1924244-Rhodomonas_salina.1
MFHPSVSFSLQSRSSAGRSLWCGVETTTPGILLFVTRLAHPPSLPVVLVPPSSCLVTPGCCHVEPVPGPTGSMSRE